MLDHEFLEGFKPINIEAYDGTIDPRVWMFVVLHCMLERTCVVHRWIWLRRPFDASPRVDRVLAYVRRCLPLYVGREVVYPAM